MIGLALIAALIQQDGFVLASTVSFLAGAPVIVREFGFPMGSRYSALLLPPLFLAVAALAQPHRGGGVAIRRTLSWGWPALCLVLMIGSGWRVQAYYREESARGHSNRAMNALVDLAVATCEHVVLDNRIGAAFPAGGTFSRVVEARLNLQGIRPVRADDTAALANAMVAAQRPPACAILSDAHLTAMHRASPMLVLRPLAALPASEYGEGMSLLLLGDLPVTRP